MPRNKNICLPILLGGIFSFIIIALLSISLGNISFSPVKLLKIILGRADRISMSIFKYSRLPRTLACIFAGAALSVSGAILQNVLSNKLAAPSIIGVNAGAGLGVVIAGAFGAFSGIVISASAFLGSLTTVVLISVFSYKTGASKTTVILGGVALNSILSALCESITVISPELAMLSMDFRVGGFSSVSYARLIPAMVLIALALIATFTLTNELDVLTLGDETAQGLGLYVRRYRILFLMLSALLAGSAVSFSGLLGFIGLIVPHFIRRLIGNESKKLIPLCALYGAAFVTLCDLISRLVFAPFEMPVGVLMAVIGGPLFILLLINYRGGHRSDTN